MRSKVVPHHDGWKMSKRKIHRAIGDAGRSAALLAVCVAVQAGCKAPGGKAPTEPRASREPQAASLEQRVNSLWQARQAEDWETVFDFEVPSAREQATVAQFVSWAEANEPFQIHEYEVLKIEQDGDLGWAKMRTKTSVRRFPNSPVREVERWEKWCRRNGEWYPVPRAELENYPVALSLRDTAEEQRLLDRFDEALQAKQAGDWDKLYQLSDPRDYGAVPFDTFAEAHNRILYVDCDVEWVQATDHLGVVRAVYVHRFNDPNMTKMLPRELVINEEWVRQDGQWYLDLSR